MQAFTISATSLEEEYQWIVAAKLNPTEFTPLYKKYYIKIFTYIDRRIQNKELSSDLTSQVFINAIQRIHSYEDKGYSFGSWLYRIAHNEMCQEFRNVHKNRMVDLEDNHLDIFQNSGDYLEKEERILALEIALKKIKNKYFQLIELRYFENLSFNEIGVQLGISENTAKVRCFRALDKLKDVYKLI